MKKLYTRLFVSLSALSMALSASAYDFKVDGIIYDKTSETEVALANDPNGTSYSGVVTIPPSVTYDGKTYSVTAIGEQAFYYESDITSVSIPETVTSIGAEAFYNCSNLSSVTIPATLSQIDRFAFGLCKSLTQITLGQSLTFLGNKAFSGCTNLATVYCYATTPPENRTAFDENSTCKTATLYIPHGTTAAYKAKACWSDFSNIVEMEESGVDTVVGDDAEVATYYNLQGVSVSSENLTPGVYIRHQGNKATKVLVK